MATLGRPRNHDPIATEIRQAIQYATLPDLQRFVAKSGPDVLDGEARSPLMYAASEGKKEIVEWLITMGADVDHQDREGMSALHLAVARKHRPIVQLLLAQGAKVDHRDRYGNTPLWRAAFDARGEYDFVDILVSHGASPDSKNEAGRSPFDFAVQIGDETLKAKLRRANQPPEPTAPSGRGSS